MKKLNPKILGITFMILSMLVAGSFGIKTAISPGAAGMTSDDNPGNGGE